MTPKDRELRPGQAIRVRAELVRFRGYGRGDELLIGSLYGKGADRALPAGTRLRWDAGKRVWEPIGEEPPVLRFEELPLGHAGRRCPYALQTCRLETGCATFPGRFPEGDTKDIIAAACACAYAGAFLTRRTYNVS